MAWVEHTIVVVILLSMWALIVWTPKTGKHLSYWVSAAALLLLILYFLK
jgi:hypothetical protein